MALLLFDQDRLVSGFNFGLQRLVFFHIQVIGAGQAVAGGFYTEFLGGILQFTIAITGASYAIERMIGDIKLKNVAAQHIDLVAARVHHHALLGQGCAGSGITFTTFDFHQANPAGPKRINAVGCT